MTTRLFRVNRLVDCRGGIETGTLAGHNIIVEALADLRAQIPHTTRVRLHAARCSCMCHDRVVADAPDMTTEYLGRLGTAARERHHIAFEYHAEDGSGSHRRVEPYREVVHHRQWYLLGWDLARDEWRTFRLDRMSALDVAAKPFEPRDVPGTAAVYVEGSTRPPQHHVTLRFDTPIETAGRKLISQEGAFESLGPEHCRAILWVDSYAWLAAIILFIDIDFHVEEPEDFRTHCEKLRDRLDRAVRGDSGATPR